MLSEKCRFFRDSVPKLGMQVKASFTVEKDLTYLSASIVGFPDVKAYVDLVSHLGKDYNTRDKLLRKPAIFDVFNVGEITKNGEIILKQTLLDSNARREFLMQSLNLESMMSFFMDISTTTKIPAILIMEKMVWPMQEKYKTLLVLDIINEMTKKDHRFLRDYISQFGTLELTPQEVEKIFIKKLSERYAKKGYIYSCPFSVISYSENGVGDIVKICTELAESFEEKIVTTVKASPEYVLTAKFNTAESISGNKFRGEILDRLKALAELYGAEFSVDQTKITVNTTMEHESE